MKRTVRTTGVMVGVWAAVAIVAADGRNAEGQRGKPGGTQPAATAMWDNASGDRITIDNSTLPMSGALEDSGSAGQFLFTLPGTGKNKRYLN